MRTFMAMVILLSANLTFAGKGSPDALAPKTVVYRGRVLKVVQDKQGREEGFQLVYVTILLPKNKTITLLAGKMVKKEKGKLMFDSAFQKAVLALKKGQYVEIVRNDPDGCECICFETFKVITAKEAQGKKAVEPISPAKAGP